MKFKNKSEAKRAIVVLRKAKKNLPTAFHHGASPYICDNISNAAWELNYTDTGRELRKWINNMIDGRSSLVVWIKDTQNIKIDLYNSKHTRKLQTTRHNWMDWMIQEIRKQNNL